MSFFQQTDQNVFMFPLDSSDDFKPLNGTAITANPVDYPWYSRINVIPDGIDWDMPIVQKEKVWDIGAGKHPSHVYNTEQEPKEITLEMMHQDARFMALATGTCATADDGNTDQDLDITCLAKASITEDDYFLIYTIDSSGVQICNAICMDVDGGGVTVSITGTTNIVCDISGATTASDVATIVAAAIDGNTNYTASAASAVVSVTVHGADSTHHGAVLDARDGAAATDFTFSPQTYGSSTHTITEQTDNTMKRFGLHIEYNNGSDDIVADLFGCVVSSYEIKIDYEEKIIKESVTVQVPYFVVGLVSTVPPPFRKDTNPAIYANFIETSGSNYYVIMAATTSRTPEILTSATITIENEIELYPGVGYNYRRNCVSGKRIVTMNLVGFIQTNDLWTDWKDTWSDSLGYYTNAGGRLNSELNVQITNTNNEWQMSIYNWMIEEYALKLFSIDDKIMGIDITFTSATPDSSGYIIDSLVIADYTPKIFYGEANT